MEQRLVSPHVAQTPKAVLHPVSKPDSPASILLQQRPHADTSVWRRQRPPSYTSLAAMLMAADLQACRPSSFQTILLPSRRRRPVSPSPSLIVSKSYSLPSHPETPPTSGQDRFAPKRQTIVFNLNPATFRKVSRQTPCKPKPRDAATLPSKRPLTSRKQTPGSPQLSAKDKLD